MLKFVFYLFIAWAVFRILDFWWASRRKAEYARRPHSSNHNTRSKKQQEVVVTYDPRQTRSAVNQNAGEIVDFEEIEDDSKS